MLTAKLATKADLALLESRMSVKFGAMLTAAMTFAVILVRVL